LQISFKITSEKTRRGEANQEKLVFMETEIKLWRWEEPKKRM